MTRVGAETPSMESARSQPVRIALLNASAHVFGAEKSLALLVRLLAGEARSFLLISPGGACESLFRRAGVAACRHVPLPRFHKTRNPIALLRLAGQWAIGSLRVCRIIRDEKVDIIHANGLHSVLYALLAKALLRRPLIWHVRDLEEPGWAVRICARFADVLIAPSSAGRERFAELARKVILVPNPVSGVHGRTWTGTDMHGEGARFRIGLVGQMIPRKGHRTLLEALPLIAEKVPGVEAWIVGSDPFDPDSEYVRSLRKMVETSERLRGRVLFIPYTSEIDSVYAELDALAVPSTHELFGRVALEAMGAGTPVIVSRVEGLSEIIRDGENGLLVEPGDSAALAEAVVAVAQSPRLRRELVEGGHATYNGLESQSSAIAARVASIYASLLSRRLG